LVLESLRIRLAAHGIPQKIALEQSHDLVSSVGG
jgi:hypothetical protein